MAHYEDYEVGREYRSRGRTITEADIVNFAGMTGDFSQLHTDSEFAAASRYGGRVAHGLLGLTVAQGLIWSMNFYSSGEGQAGGASLGWDNWRFRGPIRIGDTVHVEWQVCSKRESNSLPGMGIITEAIRLVNQDGVVVQDGEHSTLVPRKDTTKGAAG